MQSNEKWETEAAKDVGSQEKPYVGVIDADGNFIFINSYLHKSLHTNVLGILHKTIFEFIHPADIEKCKHTIAYCLLTGGKSHCEFRLKGESHKWIKWQVTNIGKKGAADERFLLEGADIAEAVLLAQEEERTRIGHELHDNVNQILFTCKLYLDAIRPIDDAGKGIKEKTNELLLMAIEEIRKLSKTLVTPPLKGKGLISCINRLIEQLDMVDPFRIHFLQEDEQLIESIDYNIKVTLFRIVQEQIKNIIKYSQARNVCLQLSVSSQEIHLRIEDDGVGFDSTQTRQGIGLSNIYERTGLYNGKVDLETEPGKGCIIKIAIPFQAN